MYCPNCGTKNDDNVWKCSKCGAELHKGAGAAPTQAHRYIPNYLAQAILSTLFCCLPFGIVAIVYASQVNTKLNSGDVTGAEDSSNKAKMWCWLSFGIGLFVIVVYFIVMLAAGGFSDY